MNPATPLTRILAAGTAVVIVGCAGAAGGSEPAAPAAPPPAMAGDIRLAIGESHSIEDGAFEIRFVAVVSDSRCPRGETCVWEGDAVARFAVRSGADSGEFELHTASRGPRATGFAGWRVELVALEPAPVAGKAQPAGYAAMLRIARGADPGDPTR